MSAAVWCLIEAVSQHESTEVTVIVIPVKELLLIRCMEYIFDLADYTAESGSVIVRLKPSYLEKLTAGVHELTAMFDDGVDVLVKFVIQGECVDTGDQSNLTLWINMCGLSILGMLVLGYLDSRFKREQEELKEFSKR
jgi:hypothetical protein